MGDFLVLQDWNGFSLIKNSNPPLFKLPSLFWGWGFSLRRIQFLLFSFDIQMRLVDIRFVSPGFRFDLPGVIQIFPFQGNQK
jgi:hypothetical protein